MNLVYFEQSPSVYLPDSPLEAQKDYKVTARDTFFTPGVCSLPSQKGFGSSLVIYGDVYTDPATPERMGFVVPFCFSSANTDHHIKP